MPVLLPFPWSHTRFCCVHILWMCPLCLLSVYVFASRFRRDSTQCKTVHIPAVDGWVTLRSFLLPASFFFLSVLFSKWSPNFCFVCSFARSSSSSLPLVTTTNTLVSQLMPVIFLKLLVYLLLTFAFSAPPSLNRTTTHTHNSAFIDNVHNCLHNCSHHRRHHHDHNHHQRQLGRW